MGVYGLESFLEKNKPNAYCYDVSIEELANKYRNDTGKPPVVVVDGTNCLRHLDVGEKDFHWILGGQLKEFVRNTKNFVNAFKNIGVSMVFFFYGATQEEERERWILKRNYNIKKVVTLFHKINSTGSDYSTEYLIPPIVGATGRFVLKYECNCEVYVAFENTDLELTKYASEENCFAILSQDTDFVLLEGARHYLSLKHLNLDNMTTVVYDGNALKKAFDLKHQELLLLAPLMGNEFVHFEMLAPFRNKLCPEQRSRKFNVIYPEPRKINVIKLIPRILEYIKRKNIPDNGNFEYLNGIAIDIFGDNKMAEALERSVKKYISSPKPNSKIFTFPTNSQASTPSMVLWKQIMEIARKKHSDGSVTNHLYAVMLGEAYDLSYAFENYLDVDLVATATIYQPLRQRIYGILLFEKPDAKVVSEWCITSNQCPTEASLVPIIWDENIERDHPGLLTLWKEDCHPDTRWKLFIENLTTKKKIDSTKLKNLGLPYAVPVVVLYYLAQENEGLLKNSEIEVILAVAATVQYYSADDIKAMRNELRSGTQMLQRVVEISTIFLRGVATVQFLFAACGFSLEKTMPWYYFDGKLLLHKYLQAVVQRKLASELCENKEDAYQTFKQMKELIIPEKSWRS